MSKVYFILNETPPLQKMVNPLPDVYCPMGGYQDKNLNQHFDSKGQKARFLRTHKMREAEPFNPNKSLGGTNGNVRKQSGSRGNVRAIPTPSWVTRERGQHV